MLLLGQAAASQAAGGQGVVYRGPTDHPTVALTFDDGYAPERCLQIADILDEHGVPATWFPNGVHVAAAPKVWRSIAQRFPIANHTLNHPSLVGMSAGGIRQELKANESLIERVTGRPMARILRPTFGAYDDRVLRVARELGYRVVLWDVTAADTSPRGTDRGIAANALSGSNGSIILMHCGPEVTPRILPIVIARYACAGYRFATLPSLLAGRPGKRAIVDCPPPKLPTRGRQDVGPSPRPARNEAAAGPVSRRDAKPKDERLPSRRSGEPPALQRFRTQSPAWTDCADSTLECATIGVPLDHGDPDLGLAEVTAYRATSSAGSAPPLIVQADAPGTSATASLSTFATGAGQSLSLAYDLVAFEPRGVEDGVGRDSASGPAMGAVEVAARDLDILRAILGQDRLDFYGTASGTSLGVAYAALFPERVGRMVLDGPGEDVVGEQDVAPMARPGRMAPAEDEDRPAPIATPTLVVGSLDALTSPFDPLRASGGKPPSSVLVGHVGPSARGYGIGNACIDDAVNAYFLEGLVPQDGLAC